MEIADNSFLASDLKPFPGNLTNGRNPYVMAAILFSLALHLFAGWAFLKIAQDVTSQRRTQTFEVSIVTPPPKKIMPVLPPPPDQIKQSLRSEPLPAPSSPPKPAPAARPLQEINRTVEKVAAGSQSMSMPVVPHLPAPVTAGKAAGLSNNTETNSAGLAVIGPSYDAAYLSNPAPPYPAVARKLKLQGTATVRVLVTPEGRPKS